MDARLLRYRLEPGEVRRYTVDFFLRLADVRSHVTLLSSDKVQKERPDGTWVIQRKTRVFRPPDLLMDQILPDALRLAGAPGDNGQVVLASWGPKKGSGFRFPAEAVRVGQNWISHGSVRMTYEPPEPGDCADMARLRLDWSGDAHDCDLQGQVVFAMDSGVILGVQALSSWSVGAVSGHILVQTRLRERFLATPEGRLKVAGPAPQELGF